MPVAVRTSVPLASVSVVGAAQQVNTGAVDGRTQSKRRPAPALPVMSSCSGHGQGVAAGGQRQAVSAATPRLTVPAAIVCAEASPASSRRASGEAFHIADGNGVPPGAVAQDDLGADAEVVHTGASRQRVEGH